MKTGNVQLTFKDSAGVVQETELAMARTPDLTGGRPWRLFRWHHGQAHYSGWYWSATMGKHVVYESRLELARLLLADFDPRVVSIAAQPFHVTERLEGRTRRHVPDYLLLGKDGVVTVVNVKPAALATVIAMIFGSVRYTLDARSGLIARAVLAGGRGQALLAKAVVTATAGAVIGVLGGLCTAVVTGLDGSVLPDLFGAMLSAAAGAVIGLCVGVLVRNHFAAPVAVLAVHLGSILVLQSWPAAGAALPLGATIALVSDTQPDLLPQPAAIAVLIAWTAIASACSWLAMTMRDLG